MSLQDILHWRCWCNCRCIDSLLFVQGQYGLSDLKGMVMYGILLAIIITVIPNFFNFSRHPINWFNHSAILSAIGPVSTILAYFFLGENLDFFQIIESVPDW